MVVPSKFADCNTILSLGWFHFSQYADLIGTYSMTLACPTSWDSQQNPDIILHFHTMPTLVFNAGTPLQHVWFQQFQLGEEELSTLIYSCIFPDF